MCICIIYIFITELGEAWCLSDDSDFDLSSGDEDSSETDDDDDDGLCNTMLVTGPHGSGKTSMVYALAQELGYKVCVINICILTGHFFIFLIDIFWGVKILNNFF